MAVDQRDLRYIDSDGHILEPPTAMLDFAPAEFRDRIWHVETDADGIEYSVWNGKRMPSTGLAGTAGFSDEDVDRVRNGELSYSDDPALGMDGVAAARRTWTRTASTCRCCTRRRCSGSRACTTSSSARVQARVYNDWCADAPEGGPGPPVRRRRAAADPPPRRRAGCRRRDPARRRARRGWCRCSCGRTRRSSGATSTTRSTTRSGRRCRTPSCPVAFHPFLAPDLPGACAGLKLARGRDADGSYQPLDEFEAAKAAAGGGICSRTSTSPRRSPTPST